MTTSEPRFAAADVQTASPFVQQSPHPPSAGKPPAHPRAQTPPSGPKRRGGRVAVPNLPALPGAGGRPHRAVPYPAVTRTPDILPKFLALLSGLATKDHEALAACGIGALSRLLLGAGHGFDENAWTIAVDALADAMTKTPDVRGLVKENASGDVVSSASNGVAVEMTAEMEASVVLGTYPSAWLRASGTCACHASTQRLLVSAAAEAYFRHGRRMSAGRLETLTRAGTMRRARRGRQRRRGAVRTAGAGDGGGGDGGRRAPVPPGRRRLARRRIRVRGDGRRGRRRRVQVPPGPAARRARGGGVAGGARGVAPPCTPPGRSPRRWGNEGRGDDRRRATRRLRRRRRRATDSPVSRLESSATLRGSRRTRDGGCVGAQARDEINARVPLAVDALKALARFSDDLFAEKVEEAFPALDGAGEVRARPGGGDQGARGGFHREDRSVRDRFVG